MVYDLPFLSLSLSLAHPYGLRPEVELCRRGFEGCEVLMQGDLHCLFEMTRAFFQMDEMDNALVWYVRRGDGTPFFAKNDECSRTNKFLYKHVSECMQEKKMNDHERVENLSMNKNMVLYFLTFFSFWKV